MPELGKATYFLTLNTSQFTGDLAAAETRAKVATTGISTSFNRVAVSEARVGAESKVAAAGMTEAGVAAERAGAQAGASSGLWGKASNAIVKAGRSGQMAGMVGLGAAYFAVKGGLSWLKESQQGWLAVAGAIHATGGVAGVTQAHAGALADSITNLTGDTRGANLQLLQMVLRFNNIRNVGTGNLAIFDRTAMMIENIAVVTHRSTRMIALAFGKVMQDPANNLNSLGRAGIRFNKAQQDMVKSIQSGKVAFQGQTGVLGAQLYVFKRLASYEGAAAKQQGSLTVQFHKAKDAIDKAAASILHGLAPAMLQLANYAKNVAQVLSHHTTALKNLIVAYIAIKVVMIAAAKTIEIVRAAVVATRLVMLAFAVATRALSVATATAAIRQGWLRTGIYKAGAAATVATGEETALAGAETAAGTAAEGASVATDALGVSLLGTLGPIAVVAAAVAGLVWEWNSLTTAQNQAVKAWNGVGTAQRQANQFYADRVKAHERAGMTPAAAKALASKETLKQTGLPGGMQAIAAGVPSAKVKLPSVPKDPAKTKKPKHLTGASILPLQMQIDEMQASITGGKAYTDVLRREEGYLRGLLSHLKGASQRKLDVLTELSRVTSQLAGLVTKQAGGKYHGIIPIGMSLAYQKALRTKTLNDDVKVLKQEETYLQKMVNNHKLSAIKQLAASTELTRVQKKLADDLKKQAAARAAASNAFDKQMQAFVDTRGSFFNQFASSIFGGSPGGLTMGASSMDNSRTANVSQHNTFHEIPKDKYTLARHMQSATAAALN